MNIQDIKTLMENTRKEIKTNSQSAIDNFFKELFESEPNLKGVRWTQYTPYFDDGDPCEFWVNEFNVAVDQKALNLNEDEFYDEGYEIEIGEEVFEFITCRYGDKQNKELKRIEEKISQLFSLDDEVFLMTYGNHVEITVTKEETTIEEYDHD